jgi:hypothetical protein
MFKIIVILIAYESVKWAIRKLFDKIVNQAIEMHKKEVYDSFLTIDNNHDCIYDKVHEELYIETFKPNK